MKKQIQDKTVQYFSSGFHCAESIAKAILEQFDDKYDPQSIKAASAFQGGIGKSKQDVCGALTGGLVALGILYGRTSPAQSNETLAAMAAQFRTAFIEKLGSTNCAQLIKTKVNSKPDYTCIQLTRDAAGLLADILNKLDIQEQQK